MIPEHILTALLLVPLAGTFIIPLSPEKLARKIAIILGVVMVALASLAAFNFNPVLTTMQLSPQPVDWIVAPFHIQYHVGVDGLSLCLVMLTTFVALMSIIASEKIGQQRPQLYYSMVMLLISSIIGVFISLDLVQFFILYELELVPMYFLIAIWGGPNRNYAAMKFLLYTFFGGILMLGALLYTYLQLGQYAPALQTFDMVKLATICPNLAPGIQAIAFLGFFLAFIIKLPSFPFHTWLPDAHVEAPTPISMILAGLLLKMGSYGLVRICLGFFPDAVASFAVFIIALGAFNIVWAAIACLVQDDMKRIIAYSSVSHMGFVLLGIGSLSAAALSGAIFQMISHGVISALLFFMVGVVYDRCHTRSLAEIGGGLAKLGSRTFYFWMLAALANLGLPALSGFVAEVTVLYGSYTSIIASVGPHHAFAKGCILLACTGTILTAGYMLWLLKRLFYGPVNSKWEGHYSDATSHEVLVAAMLSFMIIALGICPMLLTSQYTAVADRMIKDTTQHLLIGLK